MADGRAAMVWVGSKRQRQQAQSLVYKREELDIHDKKKYKSSDAVVRETISLQRADENQ